METLKVKFEQFIINTLPNDWSGVSISQSESWEPHITKLLRRNFTPDSVFIDVGSNYGWHSITSSPYCGTIYSFEPQKFIHDVQIRSINENGITNINLYNCGVGDKNETSQMRPVDYNSPSIHMGDLSVGEGGETIEIRTLDSFELPQVDFIKIDVQGYEKFVLEGSTQTIERCKPTIIIEMENHQLDRFKYGVVDLFKQIRDFGYYIYFLDYFYPSDHVCVHKDKLQEFIKINGDYITELNESNELNRNIENGVTEKITYEKSKNIS